MERNVFEKHTYEAPGGEQTVYLFIEKRDICTTYFISSYFPPTFLVIACDSRHCVKQNAKQNVKMPPPKACRAGACGPLAPPPPSSLSRHWDIVYSLTFRALVLCQRKKLRLFVYCSLVQTGEVIPIRIALLNFDQNCHYPHYTITVYTFKD